MKRRVQVTILQSLVIAAAVLWIYWPVLHGGWLWDDDIDITENPIIHSPTGLWSIWLVPGSLIDYYPIKASVQWLQWHLWGMETLGYHLTNVVLHLLGALLVWRLLSRFGLRLAWLGALIFAIHPVQVESVAWIAELKNTLSLPFFLLALCAWIDYEEQGKRRDYFLALGLFLVAMLCKPAMVMFPVVILLYGWWKRSRIGWNDLKVSAPFFLVSLMVGLMTVWCQHDNATQQAVVSLGDFFSRLACAGLSFSFYFSKCFLPVELMPIYPKWTVDPPAPWQFLPWLVWGGVIWWFWTKRRNWGRHALMGLGFFLILLLPFLGLNAISYMDFTWVMDHFLYLPIIGLIGLVIAGFEQIGSQLPGSFRPYGIGLVVVVAALLIFQSHSYAKIFINEETLCTYILRHNPEAWLAHNNLGTALVKSGHLSEAMEQYEEALQLKPDFANAYYNRGVALFQTGRLSEAMEQYRQALRINSDYADACYNLALVLQQTGRLSEAIAEYQQALRIRPDNARARNNLGNALLQTGRLPEAMEQYQQALRINPGYAEAHNNLGSAFGQAGRLPEAMEQFEQALQLKPDYAEAHKNLGMALSQTGQLAEAMKQYEEALRLEPDLASARDNLTRLQALQKPAVKH